MRNLYAARVENRYLLIYAPSWEFNILEASGARAATDSLFSQSTRQKGAGKPTDQREKEKKRERERTENGDEGGSKEKKRRKKKIWKREKVGGIEGCKSLEGPVLLGPTFASQKGLTTRTTDSRIRHSSLSPLVFFSPSRP